MSWLSRPPLAAMPPCYWMVEWSPLPIPATRATLCSARGRQPLPGNSVHVKPESFLTHCLFDRLLLWFLFLGSGVVPAKRIPMRKIREMLRLRLKAGLSIRQISASTKTSVGAIQKLLARADALNLNWPLPEDMDDGRLAAQVYLIVDPTISSTKSRSSPWGRAVKPKK